MTDSIYSAQKLIQDLKALKFGSPVAYIYNPLEYAFTSYHHYLEEYGRNRREVILLGMNPGPWGMVQTGVPFGEVEAVRDWLQIKPHRGKPEQEHPKRPVTGFECSRSEVSGRRLWGWAKKRFKSPERFFERFLILNFCPLAFLEESGRNLTPNKLPSRKNSLCWKSAPGISRNALSTTSLVIWWEWENSPR